MQDARAFAVALARMTAARTGLRLFAVGLVIASAGCGSRESASETVPDAAPDAAPDVTSLPEGAPRDAAMGERDTSSGVDAGDAAPDSTMSSASGSDAASDVATDDVGSIGPIADGALDAIETGALAPDAGAVLRCRMLVDVNPGIASSYPSPFVPMGGALYFAADDGVHGVELWRTDGTAAGTHLVSDINPGNAGALAGHGRMVAVDNVLYFSADDGMSGSEPWRSDGTSAGTFRVADVVSGSGGSSPAYFTVLGSQVLFVGYPATGPTLYRTDGTGTGTYELVQLHDASDFSTTYYIAVLGGAAFFMGNDTTHGFEPWLTDGTVAGTSILKDIVPGPIGSGPTLFATAEGKVYFQDQAEPWITDGTSTGTVQLAQINPGPGGSYASGFTGFNGAVFFAADDGTHGSELFRTDGTRVGTAPLANPASAGSSPSWFSPSSDQMLYSASGPQGSEPYRTDGTAAGTRLVIDLRPGPAGSNPLEFTPFSGSFFFQADDGTHGIELWRTDGTAGGTSLVRDINPGAPDGSPDWLTVWNGALYFRANDDVHGNELWKCAFEAASSDAGPDPGTDGSCPSTPPSMVRVGAYCVDSTEVTNAQYAAFLAAKGSDVTGQVASCAFNTSYQPLATGSCNPSLYDPTGRADYPVVCVNWCDAAAYCAWAGKRLCGSTGGGPTSPYYFANAKENQWMNACSGGAQHAYPYGDTYRAGTCVDGAYGDAGSPGLRPVLEARGCEGGFPGIFGMSGNAAEWEDACVRGLGDPSMDTCYARGGSMTDFDPSSLSCTGYGYNTRQFAYPSFGFRCCAEVR